MKSKFYKLLLTAFISAFSLSGCTDEHYTVEENTYVGAEVTTRQYIVYADEWEWNDIYKRYEYEVGDVKELTEDIYETGSVIGTIFLEEVDLDNKPYEIQKTLPFVQTYPNENGPGTYTETISFDIYYQAEVSSVMFYIQSLDGRRETPHLGDYTFKVAYVKDSGY